MIGDAGPSDNGSSDNGPPDNACALAKQGRGAALVPVGCRPSAEGLPSSAMGDSRVWKGEDVEPVKIVDGVSWVGAHDADLRLFDLVMHTPYGTSYNAYLVQGSEKAALVETVKAGFEEDLLGALGDRGRLDYVVVNHTEPDHAGALGAVLARWPEAVVVGTKRAIGFIGDQLNREVPARVVKAGDTLELGGKTLHFLPAPFLHWPDTMFTWLAEDRVLFSGDVFGAHYATPTLFDDTLDATAAADHAAAAKFYYDAIMGPFAGHVAKGVQKLGGLEGFPPAVICPSHGPVLRRHAADLVDRYRAWSAGGGPKRAVVCYASVYGYTKRLAEAVGEGLRGAGVEMETVDLAAGDIASAAAACWAADAVVLGSPTLNGVPAPQALEVLAHFDPFRAKGKVFGAFGSYGWSGEAVDVLHARAAELKMLPVEAGFKVAFAPTDEDLAAARAWAAGIAAALNAA